MISPVPWNTGGPTTLASRPSSASGRAAGPHHEPRLRARRALRRTCRAAGQQDDPAGCRGRRSLRAARRDQRLELVRSASVVFVANLPYGGSMSATTSANSVSWISSWTPSRSITSLGLARGERRVEPHGFHPGPRGGERRDERRAVVAAQDPEGRARAEALAAQRVREPVDLLLHLGERDLAMLVGDGRALGVAHGGDRVGGAHGTVSTQREPDLCQFVRWLDHADGPGPHQRGDGLGLEDRPVARSRR